MLALLIIIELLAIVCIVLSIIKSLVRFALFSASVAIIVPIAVFVWALV